MHRSTRCIFLLAACLSFGALHANPAEGDPLKDPGVQKVLRAMDEVDTWYHPDLFGEFAGMRQYAEHDYAGALKYFKIGAFYADKLSQLSIGLMYAHGEGVPQDEATAYAWLVVAAERGYPKFVEAVDRQKVLMTPEQMQQAQPILAEIRARYGDAVAKPRIIAQLREGRTAMTGSHIGYDFGVQVKADHPCTGGGTVVINGMELPKTGCPGSNLYSPERWDPKEYFVLRDSQWKATVTVGEVKDADAGDKDKSKPAAAKPGGKP